MSKRLIIALMCHRHKLLDPMKRKLLRDALNVEELTGDITKRRYVPPCRACGGGDRSKD
jgi:hypothetical protein